MSIGLKHLRLEPKLEITNIIFENLFQKYIANSIDRNTLDLDLFP